MYNILVTGSNGQLGNCLRSKIVLPSFEEHNWIFTDHNDLDITNKEIVENFISDKHIDIVINCAAYTDVNKAEEKKIEAFNINGYGPKCLAEACKKHNATLIHISTDYVFNGWKNTPYTIKNRAMPINVYGQTKLDGENFIKYSRCKSIIIRTSWLYSEFGNNFVKKTIDKLSKGENMKVVCDQVGSPTNANDLADFIYHIINTNQINKTGIYHFSNKGVCSWYDFAFYIKKKLKGSIGNVTPCFTKDFPSPVKRPSYSVLDCSLTETIFNFTIPHWSDSIKDFSTIYLEKRNIC